MGMSRDVTCNFLAVSLGGNWLPSAPYFTTRQQSMALSSEPSLSLELRSHPGAQQNHETEKPQSPQNCMKQNLSMSPAEILYARETSICYALDNVVLIYSKAAKLIFTKTREISCIVFLYGKTSFRGTLLASLAPSLNPLCCG